MAGKKKEIWIETCENRDGTCTFKIATEWGCLSGFKKNARKKVFDAISKAMNELYPNADVNPWLDAKPGTPDF